MANAAFPFVEVKIDTSALVPIAERSPGVIAVVGKTPNGGAGGAAAPNTPVPIDTLADAATYFAATSNGVVQPTTLYNSLAVALLQDPKPSKIYGVRVDGDDYGAALSSLEGMDDINFVSLANESTVGAAGPPATNLMALKAHVESMSAQGQKRIGVAMIDPGTAKSTTYVADVVAAVSTAPDTLKSDSGRMVLVAARGATTDVATAAMAAMAGYAPHISLVLKKIRGVNIPKASQYSPSEIKGLAEAGIIPIIDPTLIPGESLHFADGVTFSSDTSLQYVDIVRTLDHIDFKLKAGLIGAIGDARITKPGMTLLRARVDGILGALQRAAIIDAYSIDIPVLNVLNIPEAIRTPADNTLVTTSRANRIVDMILDVKYGPATHQIQVRVVPQF